MAKPGNYLVANGQPHIQPIVAYGASGAIRLTNGGIAVLTKAGVGAMTLALPSVAGAILTIVSTTAQAHTLTVASGLAGAGAGADVGTFGGAIGDGVTLFSYGGYWHVLPGTNLNVTFA
jgi:hypothetical protein